MTAFRILLVGMFSVVLAYTAIVGGYHGWDLLSIFFRDMMAMTWPGQFNIDFMSFLVLSGLWLAWRNQFTPIGLALGVLGAFGGILVLAPYLFFTSLQAQGDIRVVLLGRARAGV